MGPVAPRGLGGPFLARNGLAMGQYYHGERRENRKPAVTPRSRLSKLGRTVGGPRYRAFLQSSRRRLGAIPLRLSRLFGYNPVIVEPAGSNLLVGGEPAMIITIEAIYENGVLRPTRPLPLKEQEVVRITIEPELSWAERTAGLLQWKGDPELLQRIAEGDEFSILEST